MVAETLDRVGLGDDRAGEVRGDALLITSEMLTNAVMAGRDWVTLRVEVHESWLGLAVSDDNPDPARSGSARPQDTHGRGVDIIAALSSEWGQTGWDGTAKTVWSRLDLPEEAPARGV